MSTSRRGDCAGVREGLRERWLQRELGSPSAIQDASSASPGSSGHGDPLDEHIESCPACRIEADEMMFLDASLERGFRLLGDRVPGPDESRIEETVRRLRDGSEAADLLRKIRRPTRILLWTTFYLFTLLACLTLAVAVIRALRDGG
jgi:hypothetical protein